MANTVLVAGVMGFDTVKNCKGTAENVLGGSVAYASVSASYFADVMMLSIAGSDFTKEHAQVFTKRKVDISGLEIKEGKTFFWAANYDKDFKNAFTEVTDLNTLSSFKPKLGAAQQRADAVFLANLDPVLQLDIIKQFKNKKLITCDTMNYWIKSNLPAVKKVIKKTDILFVSESEARMITGEYNLIKAGKMILKMGTGHVIIKLGPNGSMLVSPLGVVQVPPFLVEDIFDTTGAGDTFGGAFTGYLASCKKWNNLQTIKTAMMIGSIMASFNIESFSIDRLCALKKSEINKRIKKYLSDISF